MILGFKEFFNAKKTQPTYFREKILAGVHPNLAAVGSEKYPITYPRTILLLPEPKLHTFREDKYDRWRAGMSIQMVYRGPKYSIKDHFNMGDDLAGLQKCKSIQKVEIKWRHEKALCTRMTDKSIFIMKIDGKDFFETTIHKGVQFLRFGPKGQLMAQLISNDGFSNINWFFRYFKKDFTGKIIHWTDLRY
jgi:hypothetical protein